MSLRAALGLLLASTACNVLEIPPPPGAIAVNACDTEDQGACGSGACENGICVARGKGELTALILEITPSSGALSPGGVPFYLHVDALSGGDLEIETLKHVEGKVKMPEPAPESVPAFPECNFVGSRDGTVVREARDGTVPATVSFIPSERALGIGVAPYSATVPTAEFEGVVSDIAAEHRFVTDLPPGNYDVYVQPRDPAPGVVAPECELLPVLVRNQRITGDLEVKLPVPEVLDLTIRALPTDPSLDGWTVDLLDPTSGRVLSIPVRLSTGEPSASGDAIEYRNIRIRYSTPLLFGDDGMLVMDSMAGWEVVRLLPPSDVIAPSFVYQRSALSILSSPAIIDLTISGGNGVRSTALPSAVTIQGQTSRLSDGSPVAAAVTFVSTELEGLDRQFASFLRTVQVFEDGFFEVTVPAGRYQVRGYPQPELELATATGDWLVGSLLPTQSGKTLEFPERVIINGRALVSGSNGTAFGASVRASASPWMLEEDVLFKANGASQPAPRASGDLVGRDGDFSLAADPGVYDFFVQPEARSRYPWYVRPAIDVPAIGRSIDEFHVPFPVVHRGRVVIKGANAVVPDALIRVYAHVTIAGKYSPTPDNSVVQVAEARADRNGAFELLIPASLDARR